MDKNILVKLRNDWLIQEVIANSIGVVAVAYFVVTCIPSLKENLSQTMIWVSLATSAAFSFGFLVRKFAAAKIVHVVIKTGRLEAEELKAAKVQAFHFPLWVSAAFLIRWTCIGYPIVFFPLYFQGKCTGFDLVSGAILLFLAGITTLALPFLCSERALADFLGEPEIEACSTDGENVLRIKITGKIIALLLSAIVPLAGNFCAVLVIAAHYNVSLGSIKLGFILLIAQTLLLSMINGSLLSLNISKFLGEIVSFFEKLARDEGNLNQKIAVGTNDELGDLGKWFNIYLLNLKNMIKAIKTNSNELDNTSKSLSDLAVRMNERAEVSSQKSGLVAAASEEMGVSLKTISESMDKAAENVNTVAASTEEMTSTVNEIAEHSAKARQITETAVKNAETAKVQVDELGVNAHEIDQVTEAISEISEQTNLLALNATIEAARAGEAGKGFAVVANEIKELARQTSEATSKIKQMVTAIQNSSTGTTEQINSISTVIKEVNDFVSSIAAAVEEQSNANREVASKVADVSTKNQEINTNVSQISQVSGEIVEDIAQVSRSIEEISADSQELRRFGTDMANLSSNLMQMVGRFNV